MFKVYCPSQYNHLPHKLMMYHNGSVSKNVKYKNVCKEQYHVHIAYNNEPHVFEIVNDSIVEFPELHGNNVGVFSNIVNDYEIIDMFKMNHEITVKWINCNSTWGVYDNEAGKWTGAVRQVNMDHDAS